MSFWLRSGFLMALVSRMNLECPALANDGRSLGDSLDAGADVRFVAGSPDAVLERSIIGPQSASTKDALEPVAQRKPRSLRVNSAWALAGSFVYASCQWGMLMVLAKFGSPEMVGQFALALAVTAPIVMLSMLQLRAVQATDAQGEYQFGHYLALRIITSILAILAIVVVALFSKYRTEVTFLILAVGIFKATESVSDAYHGLMQKCERMDCIAVAKILKGPSFLVALAVTVCATGSVAWGVVAMTVASLTVLLTYERGNVLRVLDGERRNASCPLWQWHRLASLAWLTLPLGVVMMLLSLNNNIPRYFIERMLGERMLGYFAALAYLQVAGTMLIGSLGQSATPRLAKYYATGQRHQYVRLLTRLVASALLVGVGGTIVAQLFGSKLLTILYRADYAQHVSLFVCLMAAAGVSFVASMLGYGMTAARLFRIQVVFSGVSATLMGITCLFAIPQWGLVGGACALLSVAIAQTFGATAVLYWAVRSQSASATSMP